MVMILQLLLCLSIIVVFHEMGHFLPAKWFKTKVEKFYLFFNPGFSLFKKKIGETEYGIGWLPLGGYVKIAGMIDESMDSEQMNAEPQPWEFRSKPAWQRLIIMTGGVIVNYVLGSVILGMFLWVYGEGYLPNTELEYGIQCDSLGYEIGLQNGDKIISVSGESFDEFNGADFRKHLIFGEDPYIEVKRDGKLERIQVESSMINTLANYRGDIIAPRLPFIVDTIVNKDAPAYKAGLERGDRIIGLDGTSTPFFSDFARKIEGKSEEEISLTLLRMGDTVIVDLITDEDAKIGVYPYGPEHYFELEYRKYSLIQSIPKGFVQAVNVIGEQIKGFGLMFSGKINARDSLMGPVGITKLFGNEWNWLRFWNLTAMLSLIIGFVNILPIPGLDGGYVLITLFEMLTGRKPSDKTMERIVTVGFVIIMTFFVLVTCNDILKL